MSTKSKQIGFFVVSLLMMGVFWASMMMMSANNHDLNAKMIAFWINIIGSLASAIFAFSLLRKAIALSLSAKTLISFLVFLFPLKTIFVLLIAEIVILIIFLQPIQLQERQE